MSCQPLVESTKIKVTDCDSVSKTAQAQVPLIFDPFLATVTLLVSQVLE